MAVRQGYLTEQEIQKVAVLLNWRRRKVWKRDELIPVVQASNKQEIRWLEVCCVCQCRLLGVAETRLSDCQDNPAPEQLF